MPIFNTPITTDDNSLSRVLGQNLPVALYLYDSRRADRLLDEAITKAANRLRGRRSW